MQLEDLKQSVEKMSAEDLYAMLLDVRKERRTAARTHTPAERRKKESGVSLGFLQGLLEETEPEEALDDTEPDLDELESLLGGDE